MDTQLLKEKISMNNLKLYKKFATLSFQRFIKKQEDKVDMVTMMM
jgi:hypothetical protein